MSITNIYGPNKDDPEFFAGIHKIVDFKIVSGDFNIVHDNNFDKIGGKPEHSHKKSKQFVNTWMEECDTINIWRHMHPNKRRYTYH